MPARNVVKTYVENSYYHIYNRGVSKQVIFLDKQDYVTFLGILRRYLDRQVAKTKDRHIYKNYALDIDLVAYCLMPNHFHLLVYQRTATAISALLQSISVSYAMYFNKKYQHVGTLFQQRYRGVLIDDDAHFAHISRYIHMNPTAYRDWPWSSLKYFTGEARAGWVHPGSVPHLDKYLDFLAEYDDRRDELRNLIDDIK